MRHTNVRILSLVLAVVCVLGLFTGCAQTVTIGSETASMPEVSFVDLIAMQDLDLSGEAIALSTSEASLVSGLSTSAPGIQVKSNDKAIIDYSNTADGYVMAQFTAATTKKLKAQVKGPTTTYTYNLTAGVWATFPLSDGNGAYQVSVYENVEGTKYSTAASASFNVTLKDEFAPYLRPNQYVDYAVAPNTVAKAAELTQGMTAVLDKVAAVYQFVVTGLTYDKQLAATVQSGYLPVLDTVLAKKTGICFDYAALMAGMLRSQGVPCKLVVGYAGTTYHAWISVYSAETGWIDSVVYFDGTTWQRMDPTFASSGKQSQAIMNYIGDGTNYSAKYFY